jgi:hypothetical protein
MRPPDNWQPIDWEPYLAIHPWNPTARALLLWEIERNAGAAL